MSAPVPSIITAPAQIATPPERRRAWLFSAWITGGFCLVLGGALLIGHFAGKDRDPWRSPQLLAAKEQLRQNPRDAQTKERIRTLDLQLRQRYFQQLARTSSGVILLLTGSAIFLIAYSRGARRTLPNPGPQSARSGATPSASAARWAVAVVGLLAAAGLLAAGLTSRSAIPGALAALDPKPGPAGTAPTVAPDGASPAELAANWPRFLGSQAGLSASTNAPIKWDAASGEGILWKVPAPIAGFNSPVVWNNKLFISGGDARKREAVCLDALSGAVVWRQAITNVPGSPTEPPEIPDSTGYAAPTMATDGRRVYVIFANGDLAALTMDGKIAWSKGFGALRNVYGHSISLATWRDRLIVQLDQGEAEDNKSKLYALDGASGKVVWERPRKVGASWASPAVFEHQGKGQVVCLSLPHAISYSLQDGAELWRVDCLNGEVCPSPVYAGGMVFVASPSDRIVGLRPDGQGDVTKTHLAWSNDNNAPDVTSPASDGELVFSLGTSGTLSCLEAKTGKTLWTQELDSEFHASPVLAGGRLYVFGQNGRAVVLQAGREAKELFRTEMGDSFHASPAIVQDRIYLRGMSNIWCLGAAPVKVANAP